MSSLLPQIKHSLSLTLHHFYPLSGNLTWPPESDKPTIVYVNGDSVQVTVAESNANFNHLSGNQARDPNELQPLVPQLPSSEKKFPVLAVQITLFPNSGICLGITSHHAAIDGQTTTLFLKFRTSVLRLGTRNTASLPFYDRTVIKDPNGFEKLYLEKFSQFMKSKSMSRNNCNNWMFISRSLRPPADPVTATFELSRADISRLKQWVLVARQIKIHPSSFEVACAYTWVCLTRARDDDNEEAVLLYVVDFRARLDPPVPATYFGNCFMGIKVSAKRSEIVGEDGIFVAVDSIMKEMRRLEDGFARNIKERLERVLSTGPNQYFATAGSTKFGLYKVDFGWGWPKKIEFASVSRTGAIFFTQSSGEDGGVEISFVRSKKEMEAFAFLYVNGLKDLVLSQKRVQSSL